MTLSAGWICLLSAGMLVFQWAVFGISFLGFRSRYGAFFTPAESARLGASRLLGRQLREWYLWNLTPVEHRLISWRASPDVLTFVQLLLGVGAGVAFHLGWVFIAGWFILASGTFDILDGRVARARGCVTVSGAFLDSTLDRYGEAFTFIGLASLNRSSGPVLFVVLLGLTGSMLVSYARARGESLGVEYKGGLMQRPERIVTLALGAIFSTLLKGIFGWKDHFLLIAVLALIAVGTNATAIDRIAKVWTRLRRRAGTATAAEETDPTGFSSVAPSPGGVAQLSQTRNAPALPNPAVPTESGAEPGLAPVRARPAGKGQEVLGILLLMLGFGLAIEGRLGLVGGAMAAGGAGLLAWGVALARRSCSSEGTERSA